MASTPAGVRLTEAHRIAQARISAQTVIAARPLWRLLDPDDLDGTFEQWLAAMARLIRSQRSTSAALGATYIRSFKAAELAGGRAAPVVLADRLPFEVVSTSLLVTGPVAAKRGIARGLEVGAAMANAEAMSASAAIRHVLGGGRATILRSVDTDPQALGWARATSGQPCHFCAMLASRGPVYKAERTADFEAHGKCHCEPEAVYQEGAPWPTGADRFHAIWQEAKAADGDTAINFRRAIEGRSP